MESLTQNYENYRKSRSVSIYLFSTYYSIYCVYSGDQDRIDPCLQGA